MNLSQNPAEATLKELQEQIKILKHINYENSELIKYESIDNLTGLLNKDAFFRETQKLLDKYPDDNFIFMRYDIDKFQTINALFGYDEGDRLLQYCANEIATTKNKVKECVIGRMDADIFCLCVTFDPHINLQPSAAATEIFLEGFREDYRFNVSVGIYFIQDPKEPLRDIYSKATLASRKCKDSSNIHSFVYDVATDKELTHQQIISSEMHKALKQKEFVVFFQPKVDLKTRNLVGAEALVRWNHPQKGIIPPSEFIPVFYQNGFIAQLDLYVFENVCAHIKSWKDKGLKIVPISINMTQVSMMDELLPQKIFTFMQIYGIEKEYIHLEITEGSYSVDTDKSIKCAKEFSKKGIHLEMDDFGTGISSLTMLHELPIDTLKLDLRFIKTYSESKSNAGIIHFIVSLARQMELDLVAEGIETEHQLEFLKNIGCDIGQGYLFSKPVNADNFKDLLQSWDISTVEYTTTDENLPIKMNDLWIPDSNFNIIFNTIAGSAAIYEFTKEVSSVKVLKMNDDYLQVMEVEKSGKHHTFNDLVHLIQKDDLAKLQAKIAQTIETSKPFSMEVRRINIPGKSSPKWVKLSMKILFKTKTSTLMLANLEDLSSQKDHTNYLEREAKLHRDYKKQLSIYKDAEKSGIATILIERDGPKLVSANGIYLKLYESSHDHARAHAKTFFMDTIHPYEKNNVKKVFSSLIEKKQDHFRWSMKALTVTQKPFTVIVNGLMRYHENKIYADIVVRPFTAKPEHK